MGYEGSHQEPGQLQAAASQGPLGPHLPHLPSLCSEESKAPAGDLASLPATDTAQPLISGHSGGVIAIGPVLDASELTGMW